MGACTAWAGRWQRGPCSGRLTALGDELATLIAWEALLGAVQRCEDAHQVSCAWLALGSQFARTAEVA